MCKLCELSANCAYCVYFFCWCARYAQCAQRCIKIRSKFMKSVQSMHLVRSLRGSRLPRNKTLYFVHTCAHYLYNQNFTLCVLCIFLVYPCTECAHEFLMAFSCFMLLNSLLMPAAGPKWYDQRTGSVLTAARRDETSGLGKTQGDLAGSLQLCISPARDA